MLSVLKQEKDFARERFRKSFNSGSLRLRAANSSQNHARFGFIIPKKVLPKAADRNKIRRRLKAILTKHQRRVFPADIIILPQAKSLKTSYSDLTNELLAGLKKLNLWKS